MGAVIVALTYFLITLLCVGMSTISTYYGYESMLGSLTLPLTIVVACGLFASDIAILDRRSKGRSIFGPAFVLLIFTALSAASNFNYFYSREMRKDLAATRVETATRTFESNMKSAETVLQREMRLPAIRAEIEKDRGNLTNEIQNQKKGFGPEAKRYIENVRAHLRSIPREIVVWTPPAPPGTDADNKAALAAFNRIVDDALRQAEAADPWSKGLAEIARAREDHAKALQTARDVSHLDLAAAGIQVVKDTALITQRVERNVMQIFEVQQKPRPALALLPTSSDGIQLNDIMESLRSGFIEKPNIAKTAFAATMALVIDLLPLIFALVLIRPASGKAAAAGAAPHLNEADEVDVVVGPVGLRPNTRPEILGEKQPRALRKVKG